MTKAFLLQVIFILAQLISKSQGRIELTVNDEIQTFTNEAKRVFNKEDRIEIRIYPANPQQTTHIIDSLSTEGCGVRFRSGGRIFRPKTQQQQQRSSTKIVEEKYTIKATLKPTYKENYALFSFTVKEVTACQGRNFELVLRFNPQKSSLDKFSGYKNKYKFYYVL